MSGDKKISLIGFDTFETDAFETYLEKMAKRAGFSRNTKVS